MSDMIVREREREREGKGECGYGQEAEECDDD
jgi:hypothetical protein